MQKLRHRAVKWHAQAHTALSGKAEHQPLHPSVTSVRGTLRQDRSEERPGWERCPRQSLAQHPHAPPCRTALFLLHVGPLPLVGARLGSERRWTPELGGRWLFWFHRRQVRRAEGLPASCFSQRKGVGLSWESGGGAARCCCLHTAGARQWGVTLNFPGWRGLSCLQRLQGPASHL